MWHSGADKVDRAARATGSVCDGTGWRVCGLELRGVCQCGMRCGSVLCVERCGGAVQCGAVVVVTPGVRRLVRWWCSREWTGVVSDADDEDGWLERLETVWLAAGD